MTYGTPLADALRAGNLAADAPLKHQRITTDAAIAACFARAIAYGAVIRIEGVAHPVRDPVALIRTVAMAARSGDKISQKILHRAARLKNRWAFSVTAEQLRKIVSYNAMQHHDGDDSIKAARALANTAKRVLAMHRSRPKSSSPAELP